MQRSDISHAKEQACYSWKARLAIEWKFIPAIVVAKITVEWFQYYDLFSFFFSHGSEN